jgi:hypothetical protein
MAYEPKVDWANRNRPGSKYYDASKPAFKSKKQQKKTGLPPKDATITQNTEKLLTSEEKRVLKLERVRISKEEKAREAAHRKVQQQIEDLNKQLSNAKAKLGIPKAIESLENITGDKTVHQDLLHAYKAIDGKKKLKELMGNDKDFAVLVKELIRLEVAAKEKGGGANNESQGFFVVIRGLADEKALSEMMGESGKNIITNERIAIQMQTPDGKEVAVMPIQDDSQKMKAAGIFSEQPVETILEVKEDMPVAEVKQEVAVDATVPESEGEDW